MIPLPAALELQGSNDFFLGAAVLLLRTNHSLTAISAGYCDLLQILPVQASVARLVLFHSKKFYFRTHIITYSHNNAPPSE